MTFPARRRYHPIVCASALFIFFALTLAASTGSMFIDTDPLWHIAAGDLIRAEGKIPASDPWSFTAGEYRWLNISWAWDSAMSYVAEHLGWYGAASVNAIIIALAAALMFAACIAQGSGALSALLATIAAITLTSSMLRPLQVTGLMCALWLFILISVIRGNAKFMWLALLPVSMTIWVNMHGGFLVGPLLIGVFFLQALYFHHLRLARALFFTGIATLFAMLLNPYGIDIFEAARRPLTTVANRFIGEWQPFTFSPGEIVSHIYLLFFVMLVLGRKLPISPALRWLAYFWLLMGLMSVRHFAIFAVVSAPVFAAGLENFLRLKPSIFSEAMLHVYNRKSAAMIAGALVLAVCVWLPSPAARAYHHQQTTALPSLAAETEFLRKNHPQMRLLTHFNLGAILAYETRGAFPVFIDPRTETAYPPEVMRDYACFETLCDGWEDMLERYRLGGVMLPAGGDEAVLRLIRYFDAARGWKLAFAGPHGRIYLRAPK